MDYPGGFITKTAPTLNPALGNAAPGVWRLNDVLKNIKAGTWPSYDPYFENTTLLLHGNGTNGGQNNTFQDSSTNNFTITRNGNTTQGTFSPFSVGAGYWSNYFDGSGDYLTLPSSSNLAMGTGDFCIEMFVFPGSSSTQNLFTNANSSTGGDTGLGIFIRNTTQVRLASWNTAFLDTGSNAIVTNQWNHVAVCRSGTTASIFVNGTRQATGTVSNNFSSTNAFYVGTAVSGGDQLTGYISNLRAVKGSAVYDPSQTSITVPTAPLTAITNTQLLTCQDNRFRDASGNTFTITVSGNTSVQAFSPFAPTAAYSASTVGGSGYFDGTGDYLTTADNTAFDLGSGDFTFETWIYPTAAGTTGQFLISQWGSANYGYAISLVSSGSALTGIKFEYSQTGAVGNITARTYSQTIPLNAWSHIALVRASGTTTAYFNGAAVSTSSDNVTIYNSTATVHIAANPDGGINQTVFGYLSSSRLVKGTAVYTTAFTPPTAPLTNITNTSLLLNFTNAAIIDNTAKNVLETVADAQISTTQSKFGGASLAFDGSGDWLAGPPTPQTDLGSGDFTIEAWLYRTASGAASDSGIVSRGAPTTLNGFVFGYTSANVLVFNFNYSGAIVTGVTVIPANTWTHVAVSRSGTTFRLFVNGVVDATATSSSSQTLNAADIFYVGRSGYDSGRIVTGYLDDVRITKGIARYTSNFTPQTSQWQDQ
jgi:hypothetical protein